MTDVSTTIYIKIEMRKTCYSLKLYYILCCGLIRSIINAVENFDYEAVGQAYDLYNKAIENQNKKQYDIALSKYQQAIDRYFYFPQAHQNLAILYEQYGNFEQAIYHHEKAVETIPKAYFNDGDDVDIFKGGAVSNLMSTYISSSYLQQYINRKSLNKDRGSITESDRKLEQTIELLYELQTSHTPPIPTVMFSLGNYLLIIGKKNEGVDKLLQLLSYYPNHVMSLLTLGNFFFKQN